MRLKKVGVLLLVLLLSMSLMLSGCGGKAATSQKVIKLGVVQPLTGAIAYGGQAAANGTILAAEELNAKGGIDIKGEKYKIELVIEDDKGVPKESAAAATKLISKDKVPLIIGTFTSSSSFAMAEICNREEVPMISPLSSAEKLTTSGFKYFFRGRVTTHNNAKNAANFWAEVGPNKKIAMLAINDDWGKGDLVTYPPLWEQVGTQTTAKETFDQGQTDFYPVLSKMLATKPDALFITASTEPAALIFKQARELDPKILLMTSGGIDPVKTAELAGKAIEGVWFWSVDPPMTPEIADFDKRYKARFNLDSMSNAKSGYDVMMLVAKALTAGGTATDSKLIRDAMSKTEYDGYAGHYNFNEGGDSFLKMSFGQFTVGGNGAFTIVAEAPKK